MIESDILKALQTAAIAAVAASSAPALPIKVVGRVFLIPSDSKWVELISIPNNVENEFWGDSKTYRGLFKLLLHWPMNDKGAYDGLRVLESIAGYFVKGREFVSNGVRVRIYEEPNLTNLMEQPPELLFPVTIRYQCFNA